MKKMFLIAIIFLFISCSMDFNKTDINELNKIKRPAIVVSVSEGGFDGSRTYFFRDSTGQLYKITTSTLFLNKGDTLK